MNCRALARVLGFDGACFDCFSFSFSYFFCAQLRIEATIVIALPRFTDVKFLLLWLTLGETLKITA